MEPYQQLSFADVEYANKGALLHKSIDERISPYPNPLDGFRVWLP